MRHPPTNVQQDTRVVSALSGHQLNSDMFLVSAAAVGVISVEVVQAEAEEDMEVQKPFSEAKECLQ